MSEVYSELLDRMVDSYSEEWRHECECRWVLNVKADPIQLNLYLYGVEDRSQVVAKDATGQDRLIPEHARLWKDPKARPLTAHRGLQNADQLLNDVLRLKTMRDSVKTKVSPNPDGQVKLLHLWPPKLLHLSWARRTNYGVDSVAVAMRSAASFSR